MFTLTIEDMRYLNTLDTIVRAECGSITVENHHAIETFETSLQSGGETSVRVILLFGMLENDHVERAHLLVLAMDLTSEDAQTQVCMDCIFPETGETSRDFRFRCITTYLAQVAEEVGAT